MESSTQELMTSDGISSNVTTPSPEDAEGGIDWYNWANNAFLIVDPIITFGGIIGKFVDVSVLSLSQVTADLFRLSARS